MEKEEIDYEYWICADGESKGFQLYFLRKQIYLRNPSKLLQSINPDEILFIVNSKETFMVNKLKEELTNNEGNQIARQSSSAF